MNDTIFYKIQNSYSLPYAVAIDRKLMDEYEKQNEIIRSSRIYFICKLEGTSFFFKKYSRPKVLYVGETFDKTNRFAPHEKLLKATTIVKPRDIIGVYFLHMRFSYVGMPIFNNNPWYTWNDLKDINSKSSVKLLERIFIRLFDPVLNDKHNKNDIYVDNLVNEKLMKNSIRYVHVDIGMNEKYFQFVGGCCTAGNDWYNFDLENETFFTGMPNIFDCNS